MTKQTGIASIPLIFGLLLIAIIPLTINQVQKNQNLQNRATNSICLKEFESNCYTTPCCSGLICNMGVCYKNPLYPTPVEENTINCQEISIIYQKYCSGPHLQTPPEIPCDKILNLLDIYCSI